MACGNFSNLTPFLLSPLFSVLATLQTGVPFASHKVRASNLWMYAALILVHASKVN